jgi:hypothetical protein
MSALHVALLCVTVAAILLVIFMLAAFVLAGNYDEESNRLASRFKGNEQ